MIGFPKIGIGKGDLWKGSEWDKKSLGINGLP